MGQSKKMYMEMMDGNDPSESIMDRMNFESNNNNNNKNRKNMSITATNKGGDIVLPPSGNHIARCYSMIHIGTIEDEYMGEKKKMNKIRISWESSNELHTFDESKGPQPFSVSKEYTLSMNDRATLRKDLESWRGKEFTDEESASFDVTKVLGKFCMVNVIHKKSTAGKDYAAITSITPMPKGIPEPKPINPIFEFSFEQFDSKKLESLPDWIKTKIKSSDEYRNVIQPDVIDSASEVEHPAINGDLAKAEPQLSNDNLPF